MKVIKKQYICKKTQYEKPEIKSNLRLYSDGKSKIKSTVFDLISGDKETKQTKGLAYLFSINPDFTIRFVTKFFTSEIRKREMTFHIKNITNIEVTAEEFTTEEDPKKRRRADVILKIFCSNELSLAIVIEAKSIKAGSISVDDLEKQINYYIGSDKIASINKAKHKIGMVLTKCKYDIQNIVCIEWNDIINFIEEYSAKNKACEVLNDYSNFLININKDMVIYDAEVLSIPAGSTINLINRLKIYECPNTSSFNYKKALFMAFREPGGGIMSTLYKVEDTLVLNASNLKDIVDKGPILEDLDIDERIKERIAEYIRSINKFEDGEKKFYILSESEIIDLKTLLCVCNKKENGEEVILLDNRPRPKKNNSYTAYYTLSQILKGGVIMN